MNPEQATILAIDDSSANLTVLKALLKRHQYNSLVASDGKTGIELAQKGQPDLILLDVMMPGMDGFEACHILKNNKETEHIPIIFLTALNDEKFIIEGFDKGAVDYITKPFKESEVMARISTHTQNVLLKKQLQQRAFDMENFAYNAAHDLRSPLSVIEGFINILKSGPNFDPETILAKIDESSKQLRNLIDSLLNLADTNKTEMKLRFINLNELIESLILEMKALVDDSKASISVSSPDIRFRADHTQMELLFRNLLSNSIKYSRERESPKIVIDFESTEEHHIITLQDNGLGLSSEQIKELFQPFKRFHRSKAEGHGLGMAICKKVVERHHGSIGVESCVGEGSLFTIQLPIK